MPTRCCARRTGGPSRAGSRSRSPAKSGERTSRRNAAPSRSSEPLDRLHRRPPGRAARGRRAASSQVRASRARGRAVVGLPQRAVLGQQAAQALRERRRVVRAARRGRRRTRARSRPASPRRSPRPGDRSRSRSRARPRSRARRYGSTTAAASAMRPRDLLVADIPRRQSIAPSTPSCPPARARLDGSSGSPATTSRASGICGSAAGAERARRVPCTSRIRPKKSSVLPLRRRRLGGPSKTGWAMRAIRSRGIPRPASCSTARVRVHDDAVDRRAGSRARRRAAPRGAGGRRARSSTMRRFVASSAHPARRRRSAAAATGRAPRRDRATRRGGGSARRSARTRAPSAAGAAASAGTGARARARAAGRARRGGSPRASGRRRAGSGEVSSVDVEASPRQRRGEPVVVGRREAQRVDQRDAHQTRERR